MNRQGQSDASDQVSDRRVSRRGLLKAGGMAGLGAAALASGISTQTVLAAVRPGTRPRSYALDAGLGQPRKIVWAIAAIGDWNLPVDVGFYDAATMLGWEYSKVGVPLAQYSAEAQVTTLEQAIALQPAVRVTDCEVTGD